MKTITLSLLVFLSCAATAQKRHYVYNIDMVAPVQSDSLKYENDSLAIWFRFTERLIAFEVVNKSNDPIKIDWDNISVTVNGETSKILHKETVYQNGQPQPPTIVPPHASLQDVLIFPYQVSSSYGTLTGTYSTNFAPIYPTWYSSSKKYQALVMGLKGQKTGIFMLGKDFQFVVNDVVLK